LYCASAAGQVQAACAVAVILAAIRMVAQNDLGISTAAAPPEQAAMACPDGQHPQLLPVPAGQLPLQAFCTLT